jgi:hypothetical protein
LNQQVQRINPPLPSLNRSHFANTYAKHENPGIKGKKHPKKERRNMAKTITMAILGLVLVAALALPVSAAKENAPEKAVKIDDGLKNDLWNVYGEYRLRIYDTRVEGANAAVGVLGDHGCPTEEVAATVDGIEGQRTHLAGALENHDRKALKTVNQELAKLWKQFRTQMRESIKTCSGGAGSTVIQETEAAADF